MRGGKHYAFAATAVAAAAGLIVVGVRGDERGDPPELETAGQESAGPSQHPVAPPAAAALPGSAMVVRGAPNSDGVLYDPDTGAPIWGDKLPFPDPIAYPDVAAVDDGSYVVAGVPCASTRFVNSLPQCDPGGLAVARFDADARRFDVINVDGLEGETPYINILGATGSNLILQAGGLVYALPEGGGQLSAFAAPPLDGFDVACLHTDRVVAVRLDDGPGDSSPEPGQFVEEDYRLFVPFEAAVLNLETGEWAQLGGPDAVYDVVDTFELGCVDRGVLAVPSEKPMFEQSPYVTHFLDVDRGEWLEVPPPPREFLAGAPPASDGARLIISVSSDFQDRDTAVLLLDIETGVWTEEAGGDGASAGAVAVAGNQVLSVPRVSAQARVELHVTQLRPN